MLGHADGDDLLGNHAPPGGVVQAGVGRGERASRRGLGSVGRDAARSAEPGFGGGPGGPARSEFGRPGAVGADDPGADDPGADDPGAHDSGRRAAAAPAAGLFVRLRVAVRSVWPWLRLLIGAAILAALAWRLGTGAFLTGLKAITCPSALAAFGIGVATTVCCALRWCFVARRLGLRLPLWTAVTDYYRAMFLNVVLPMGVLGDVQRAVRHGKDSGDVGRGVRAVVLERTAGQIVLVVGVVLLAQSAALHAISSAPALGVAIGMVVVLAVGVFLAVRFGPARWRQALTTTFTDIRTGLLSRDTWPAVVGLSVVVLVGHFALFLVAARTAGVTAPASELVGPIALTLLASGLPINIGGWGPRESASALSFGAVGLGATQGLTVAVVYGVLTFVTTLPGAVILLAGNVGRPAGRQVEFEQGVVAECEPACGSA
jgi:uncharacterized membrane protein YbhN (UPF0104 family)